MIAVLRELLAVISLGSSEINVLLRKKNTEKAENTDFYHDWSVATLSDWGAIIRK